MNPWKSKNWLDFYSSARVTKSGLRLHFCGEACQILKLFLFDFGKWLRIKFEFPIRVNVYFKSQAYIRAIDGEQVSGTFWGSFDREKEPYIKIAVGDFAVMTEKSNEFSALCNTAASLAHELTHYYQWLNDFQLSEVQEERQAAYYSKKIVYMYLDERGYSFLEACGILD